MGGPSDQQKQARDLNLQNAQDQAALAKTNTERSNAIYGSVNPFYTNEMNNGLPFFNQLTDYNTGTISRAYAPQEGALNRSLTRFGSLPSGFATAARSDLAARKAATFDDALKQALYANFQAKQQGAQGLTGLAQIYNPLQAYSGSSASATPVMQPLQAAPNPWMGVLGGAVQGAASAIPW